MTDRFPDLKKPHEIAAETRFEGRFLRLVAREIELPGGHISKLEIVHHPGASGILPLHDDGTVTLVYQYRHALGEFIYEIPAGLLEAGEDPEHCARRELVEEVGLEAGQVTLLSRFRNSPGFTDETVYVYLGRQLQQVPQQLEDDEYLRVVRMPLSEAMGMLDRGEITDGKTVIGLLMAHQQGLV